MSSKTAVPAREGVFRLLDLHPELCVQIFELILAASNSREITTQPIVEVGHGCKAIRPLLGPALTKYLSPMEIDCYYAPSEQIYHDSPFGILCTFGPRHNRTKYRQWDEFSRSKSAWCLEYVGEIEVRKFIRWALRFTLLPSGCSCEQSGMVFPGRFNGIDVDSAAFGRLRSRTAAWSPPADAKKTSWGFSAAWIDRFFADMDDIALEVRKEYQEGSLPKEEERI